MAGTRPKDALEHYHRHYQNIRPIINKNPNAKKDRPFYQFFDDQREIVLAALKRAADAEGNAPTPVKARRERRST